MKDFIFELFDIFLHLDKYIETVAYNYSNIIYTLLFIIIFCETGLVITPFLPGDSLLFACGAIAARGIINPITTMIVIFLGAVIGDTANYHIGKYIGFKAIEKYPKVFKKEYIEKTHKFYEKYGGKTIIIARFVPIVRTFAPFMAGIGYMSYVKFIIYNITGALLWIGIVFGVGYFFGNIDIVKKNFSLVIAGIVFLSILPMIFEYFSKNKNNGT